jgi:superoxide dismutase, Cu-Zn family
MGSLFMLSLRFAVIGLAFASAAVALSGPAFAVGETATAVVKLANGTDAGTVVFTEGTAGVLLKFELKGLPPGAHAVHVHETGKCEGDLSSAGGIYNPLGAKHGFLHDEGPMAGDLPNIYASADGSVIAEVLSPFLTLSTEAEESLFDADGAAIVIQEKADDYAAEPDGGAGARLACGVISIKK